MPSAGQQNRAQQQTAGRLVFRDLELDTPVDALPKSRLGGVQDLHLSLGRCPCFEHAHQFDLNLHIGYD